MDYYLNNQYSTYTNLYKPYTAKEKNFIYCLFNKYGECFKIVSIEGFVFECGSFVKPVNSSILFTKFKQTVYDFLCEW